MNYIDDIIIKSILDNHRFLLVLVQGVLLGMIILLCLFIYLLRKNLRRVDQLNRKVSEEEEKLQLILDSTAEGIFGIDLNGICTFCNKCTLTYLKYESQEDLLGKNIDNILHNHNREGKQISPNDYKICESLRAGEGIHVDDQVFWRSDGTSFNAEYFAYPQYKNGEVIGGVITFFDITEKKRTQDEYIYLSYHDSLTGLYNRRYIEEELKSIDISQNLPISIISGDVNGLKQTNDIFGHEEGDFLIRTTADVMKNVCRREDIIARTGGDEFLIVLPKTDTATAEIIANDIKAQLSAKPSKTFNYNISLGVDTKIHKEEDIELIIKNADHNMYTAKVLDWKKFNKEIISTLFRNFMCAYPNERVHARNVSKLCRRMGKRLNLSESVIMRLREAGFMHDIGKVTLGDELINKLVPLNNYEVMKIKHHTVVGYRILNSSDFTVDIAKYVLCHHEQWDGSGYPKGLIGKEIPLISRIISIADQYDFLMRTTTYKKGYSQQETIEILKSYKGKRLDPELVDEFIAMIMEDED